MNFRFAIIVLLFFLFSCDERPDYEEPIPVQITIRELPPELFPTDTQVYIRVGSHSAIDLNSEDSNWRNRARGNAPVNSVGTVEIKLHGPAGTPWNSTINSTWKIVILRDIRAEETLFTSKKSFGIRESGWYEDGVWHEFDEKMNIDLHFSDFDAVVK